MDKKKKLSFIGKSLLAGGVAGCCAKTTTAPIDRLKILFQTQHTSYSNLGFTSGLKAIVKNEGWLALYKGNGAMMVRVFPYAAIQFMSYEQFKRVFVPFFENSPKFGNLLAGSCAGITSVACTYPLDVVRARFAVQVDERRYRSIVHCLKDIYGNEGGIRGLYRGITATIYGMIPYAGISFFTFEFMKSQALTRFKSIASRPSLDGSGKPALKITANLLCGGIAGAVAQSVSYPLDVARRQMQLVGMHATRKDLINRGSFRTLRDVYHSKGIIRGLYRGLSLNYYRVIPQVAVSFTVYELMKQVLNIY
jgi:solute carrier family 25 protein 16